MAVRAERLLIWGAGGHGKVVADVARACGHEVVGFVDVATERVGQLAEPGGARIIAAEQELTRAIASGAPLPGGATMLVLAVGDNRSRRRHFAIAGAELLPVLVHPTAIVAPSARLGAGTVILPGAIINAASEVGAACIINTGAIIEHDCVLADAVHVSPGAILLGRVRAGAESWVGAGATVRNGLCLGAECVVGMGAVVIRDVPDGTTVVGNPARQLGAAAHATR